MTGAPGKSLVHFSQCVDSTCKRQPVMFVFLRLMLSSLGPSLLLPVASFHSFLWLSNIPLYMCTTSSLFSISLWLFIFIGSMSWLLKTVLHDH